MTAGRYRFERFTLDTGNRQLRRDNVPVELNARYLDALSLLVREAGRLVSKDRFLDEVWRGVPVTDEALTQCIKTLRRQLGDDASRPRFIETVPKHGYRFIAATALEVEDVTPANPALSGSAASRPARLPLSLGLAGTLGGGLAGVIGGLFYGFAAAAPPGMGAASALLVILVLTTLLALIGAAGVAFGIAVARTRGPAWSILGGAAGGLVVGAVVKLLGLDAFNLLFGQAPAGITGAPEGALIGGAVGVGAWAAARGAGLSLRRGVAAAGLIGGAAGALIILLGGRLLGGSLDALVRRFPNSRLRLDQIGALFGEQGFGPTSHTVTGALEGALFGACVVGAMIVARERSRRPA